MPAEPARSCPVDRDPRLGHLPGCPYGAEVERLCRENLDGWHFLERRRRLPALAAVPVVLTTALGNACAEWAASLGAAGFLRKPVETEALLREVGRWC